MADLLSGRTGNVWWCGRKHYFPNMRIMVAARGEGDQIIFSDYVTAVTG